MILHTIASYLPLLNPTLQNCHEIEVLANCSNCLLKIEDLESHEKLPWRATCIIGDSWKVDLYNPNMSPTTESLIIDSLSVPKTQILLDIPNIDMQSLYSIKYDSQWILNYFQMIHPQWGFGSTWNIQEKWIENKVKGMPKSNLPWYFTLSWNQVLHSRFQGQWFGFSSAYRVSFQNVSWYNEILLFSHHKHSLAPFSIRGPSLVLKTEPTLIWKKLGFRLNFGLELASTFSSDMNMHLYPTTELSIFYRFVDNATLHFILQRNVYNTRFAIKWEWTRKPKTSINQIHLPHRTTHDTAWVAQWNVNLPTEQFPTTNSLKIPSLQEWQSWISIAPDTLRQCANQVPEWLAKDAHIPHLLFQTAPPQGTSHNPCQMESVDWRNLPLEQELQNKASIRFWKPVLLP